MRFFLLLAIACSSAHAQPLEAGSGAPSEAIRQRFVAAWFRNNFYTLVEPTPLTPVERLGSTGLIQRFRGLSASNATLALVKANTSTVLPEEGAVDVFHMRANLYSYWSSIGVNTAGYPAMDTANCPTLTDVPCQWQLFDASYALFVYERDTLNGQNFTVRNVFYTKWSTLGGMQTFGPATSAEQAVTSSISNSQASVQTFARGAVYTITSGTLSGRNLAILQPVYEVYFNNGMHSASLGFPTTEEILQSNGARRQNFEGGAIEYQPGGAAVLRPAVASVSIRSENPLRMKLGETATVQATLIAGNGVELADRPVAWTTSNGRVVTVQGQGATAVLTAAGGGTANITAISEGRTSSALAVVVAAPCCQIGEGAPSAAITQAFQDAITRNRLNVRLPAAAPVRRVGQGHVQELQDAGSSPVRYLVGISDRSSTAYVVSSAILARYEALGGPAGDLGYPASDATPGNRQLFENSVALAGNPVRLVSGSMLAKWATLGYETGPAGPPTGDPVAFVSFMATSGIAQQFRGGAIYIHSSGRGFLVTGLILAKYAGMGGPTGRLGAPTTDEFASSGLRKQEFEGGEVEYGPQDSEARVIERERRPSVSATPGAVVAGTRVRVAVGGFPPGATLRVSISGQPDFVVTTESGAYSWDVFVPPNAPTSAVIVRAMDMTSQTSAQGGYTIRAANEVQLQLTKVRGDMQTGAPATTLPLPLRVAIKDDRGNPVIGFQVRFNASPGAQVMPGSALTNESGEAEAWLRAGSTEGVALATVEAGRQVVTFSARVAAVSLPNFPKLMASDQAGALLAASASLLRYHQNRGELPAPNGPVEVAALNQHLKNYCALDFEGVQVCDGFLQGQVVNLWRLGSFVNNGIDVSVERPEIAVVRDFVAQGSPVLIALTLTCTSCPGGAMLGSHFVVATGVNQGGAILVHDPSSLFARPMLDDYLAGFTVSQTGVKGSLAAAVRLLPRTPAAAPFVVTATDAEIGLTSAAGSCGSPVEWAVAAATLQSAPSVVLRQRGCDGSQAEYQLDLLAQDSQRATITDLSAGGSRYEVTPAGAASYSVSRLGARWVLAPQATSISPGGIVNAASFTPGISPGGLMAVFGAGLARGPDHPRVEMNGLPAAVVTASPFQVNAQVPTEVQPGSHILRIQSPYGSAEQSVEVRETAPAIFVVGNGRAAILNQDATLNGPSNPERRGRVVVVFATGLGAVTLQGPFQIAGKSVTVVISGRELQPAFAGLTPGFIGLYQVNIPLPVEIPPGLAQTLFLRQGGADSNRVEVAIQ